MNNDELAILGLKKIEVPEKWSQAAKNYDTAKSYCTSLEKPKLNVSRSVLYRGIIGLLLGLFWGTIGGFMFLMMAVKEIAIFVAIFVELTFFVLPLLLGGWFVFRRLRDQMNFHKKMQEDAQSDFGKLASRLVFSIDTFNDLVEKLEEISAFVKEFDKDRMDLFKEIAEKLTLIVTDQMKPDEICPVLDSIESVLGLSSTLDE